MIDGEHPPIPGDVPPQFVVIFEKTKLPVCSENELVFIFTRLQIKIGAAKIHPDTIRALFRVPELGLAIAPDRNHTEIHTEPVAEVIFITCREVAIDTAPDVLALCLDSNDFGDG